MRTIQDIAQDMSTQNNNNTAEPMFVVQARKRIYGMNSDLGTEYAWLSDDADRAEADAETVIRLESLFKESYEDSFAIQDANDPESKTTYDRVWYVNEWESVMCFFTRNAAKEFIERNGHLYANGLRIYTDSLHHNPEMILVREHLLGMVRSKF